MDGQARMRVYIVDDDKPVLSSLSALVTSRGYEVVPCSSAEAFLETFDMDEQACVLLDVRMPGMDGMALHEHLRRQGSRVPVVIVTGHGDVPIAVQAMKAGAIDFIEKPGTEEQLVGAIELAGDVMLNRQQDKEPSGVVAERLSRLTAREREVLDHLLMGKINKEIARDLGISQRTVEIHRSRIREKMEARGLSDLIRMLR